MPYLNDDELASLHQTIDSAEKNLKEATQELESVNEELEEANATIENHDDDVKGINKSRTIQNIILSLLAGIALALAYYFYSIGGSSNSNIDINEIKQLEATRVLDSINSLRANTSYAENTISIGESIKSVKGNISGKKIYSVQIGAFSENRYTLLSETLAGISSNGDMFKYSIGLFETLKEAQDFRKELVKIGFPDAFVASYIDGVRKRIEDPNN